MATKKLYYFYILLLLDVSFNVYGAPSRKRCMDYHKALELREEEANAIFTGTVKELYPDWDHPDMYKGEIEIKRVFKGNNVIKSLPGITGNFMYKKKVMVDGLGDPHICDSNVRKYDTRIFMVRKNGNGELRLNSSLVRLTLNTIDQTDAAVKGEFTIHTVSFNALQPISELQSPYPEWYPYLKWFLNWCKLFIHPGIKVNPC